jgi:hypothetical protein
VPLLARRWRRCSLLLRLVAAVAAGFFFQFFEVLGSPLSTESESSFCCNFKQLTSDVL